MEARSGFTPTHTVPTGGLPTWSSPDPATAADNRLDALVEVQVLEETTGWAHVLCSNGWSAWVDGRQLVPLPAAQPEPAAPGAAGPAPSFAPPGAAGAPPSVPPAVTPAAAVAAPVPAQPAAPAASATRKKGGCGRIFLFGCLGFIVVLVLGGGGIFIALQTGAITTNKLLNVVGQGPAVIEVDNFRDDAIQAGIESLSSSSSGGSGSTSGNSSPGSSGGFSLSGESISLKAFDVKDNHVQNPGKYRVTFVDKAGASIGTCTLSIRGGDHYQFVALATGIMVNRENDPSKRGPDYNIKTSKLCQP